jgi:hypothetical protein
MSTAILAADYYLLRWATLRDEARRISEEAERAGPLTRRKLRHQAALVDDYSVILHHAAWRELHPDEPELSATLHELNPDEPKRSS